MENINSIVADNLKRLREQRKMSLDAVAKVSGVSKSMLGQIERGYVNPTISTMWKIANGLKVPFSELLNRPEVEFEVIDFASIQPLIEDNGHYRNYPAFLFEEGRHFEMLYIEMDPGSHIEADPHPDGTEEFITVFSGELVVRANNDTFTVKDRASLRFKADRPHQYQNTSGEVCRISMVIYYPR